MPGYNARDGRRSYVAPCITVPAMIESPMMSSDFTIADVERIAALAHLELTAEEKQLFTRQLADILDSPANPGHRHERRGGNGPCSR